MDAAQIIKETLERLKAEHQFKSDVQLSAFLGVSPSTITRWRRGELLGQTSRTLIPHVRRLFCNETDKAA